MVEVQAGKAYWWCACGRSACPAILRRIAYEHTFAPLKWVAGEAGPVWFCACKQTRSAQLCDGSHKAL